jgi:hypothetical protein
MRAFKIIPVLLAPLLFLLAACTFASGDPAPWAYQNEQHTLLAQWGEGEQTPFARLTQAWPHFSGRKRAVKAVNEYLLKMREKRQGEFSSAAYQYLAGLEFNGETLYNAIYITHEESAAVFYNDGLTVSVVIDGSSYFSGGPHALPYRCAYNFDALSGALLTLEDIWGVEARRHAAAEIYAAIESAGRLDEYLDGLGALLPQKLQADHWYMDASNIYIFYDPYDIAPYAAGIVEFVLPR